MEVSNRFIYHFSKIYINFIKYFIDGPYPTILPLAPVVLHAVVIMGLNTIYRHIAEWLTSLENHRTDREYQNSLILKRIFFDGFDCYIALFYLAFCKFDINALRNDLFGL